MTNFNMTSSYLFCCKEKPSSPAGLEIRKENTYVARYSTFDKSNLILVNCNYLSSSRFVLVMFNICKWVQ